MTHDLWTTLNRKMYEYLASVSLRELVDRQLANQESVLLDQRRTVVPNQTAVA
jgi:Rrf2 family iron-sulfur cluster assembly transcriptional regulator